MKSDSKIAAAFEKSWSDIYTKTVQYIQGTEELGNKLDEMNTFDIEDISKKLLVHSPKKYIIQFLGDLITILIHDISIRGIGLLKHSTLFSITGWDIFNQVLGQVHVWLGGGHI